jgi:hypothetical protein
MTSALVFQPPSYLHFSFLVSAWFSRQEGTHHQQCDLICVCAGKCTLRLQVVSVGYGGIQRMSARARGGGDAPGIENSAQLNALCSIG